jgi:uncharacterized protein DUF995
MSLKYAVILGTLLASGTSEAAENAALTLADISAKKAVQVTREELQALLPGAKVVNIAATGSTRKWVNEVDGKFIASSDNRASTAASGKPGSAKGKWEIGSEGTYCVSLEWSRFSTESWCRYLFKDGSEFWGARSLTDPKAEATRFTFSK